VVRRRGDVLRRRQAAPFLHLQPSPHTHTHTHEKRKKKLELCSHEKTAPRGSGQDEPCSIGGEGIAKSGKSEREKVIPLGPALGGLRGTAQGKKRQQLQQHEISVACSL
jgi:hypothetical protein